MKARLAALGTACPSLWLMEPGGAYSLDGRRWAAGTNVVMHLQLGSSGGSLIDGSTSWNTPAENALALWNPYLSGVSFAVVRNSTAATGLPTGFNNVFWADDIYGDSFGDAIAYTRYWYRLSDNRITEADVIFDQKRSWNSYRGNLRPAAAGGTLYDLRRVALHEFGHVLGLDHPDQHGQSVTAIMNSRGSDIDSLQSDDTNGARAIYGSATPASNRAPSVTASCSPCTVEAGQATTLRATATDPDGDALTYQWTAPQGAFGSASAASTAWTAPLQPGSVTATVTVQDGRGASATGTVALQVVFRDKLPSGARLAAGQSLVSTNGRYRLLYQADGNLVLYDDVQRTAPGASNTGGTSAGQAILQSDGNFVVYDAQGNARWTTGTVGNPNAYVLVQSDGNIVVYRSNGQPAWDRFSAN